MLLLAAHAADEQDGALFVVAAFTGLRLGELRALRWRDLDFADAAGPRAALVRTRAPQDVPEERPACARVPMIDQVIPPLDGLSQRARFTDADDLVFVSAAGERDRRVSAAPPLR